MQLYIPLIAHDFIHSSSKALLVGPVNMIPEMVQRSCPRVLFNRELVGSFCKANGMKTRRKSYDTSTKRDIFHGGDCDDSIRTLCALLGWEAELDELNKSTRFG
jgi:NAD-dependent deacetylase sirtuin 2